MVVHADQQEPGAGGRRDRVRERDGTAAAFPPIASGDDRAVHDASSVRGTSPSIDGSIPR
jgi:hypothetical protein